MGNKDKKAAQEKNTALIDQERTRVLDENKYAKSYLEPERTAEKSFADSLRGDIVSGYQGLINRPGGVGGASGGGISAPNFKLDPLYGKLEKGYTPLSKGIHESLGGYQDFAKTGGITAENANRIRGNGVFDEFAQTGGVSDADRSNIRSRGIAPVGAFYGNIKNQLARRQNVTGGYGTGYDASTSKLARDSAIASGAASRDTELGISDMVRKGRFEGASALSGAEQGLSSQIQQGRLAGLGGLTEIGKFGYGGLEGIAGKKQSIANANASARSSASNANRANTLAEQKYRDSLTLQGLGGLESVYGSNAAELARYDDSLYNNRGLTGNQVNQSFGQAQQQQAQANSGPSGWDRALQWGSLAAGIGGAAFTGGASMAIPAAVNAYQKKKSQPQTMYV